LSGRGLCDELITRPEESYRLCCVVMCDLETSRLGAPYIYDISRLRVKSVIMNGTFHRQHGFILYIYRIIVIFYDQMWSCSGQQNYNNVHVI